MTKNSRPEQITSDYNSLITKHLDDLLKNRAEKMMEIEDFAAALYIHPTHLSNTIKILTGESACGVYQSKILALAQQLLADPGNSIKEVALRLTFEPSQFTKWFKRIAGETPKAWREKLKS